MRKIISEMIRSDPDFEVVGIARDGEDGVHKALELRPDLITLDIEMPRKDGITALREIRLRCSDFKPAVLMCSSLTVAGSDEALKAMRIGAADIITKDPAVVGKGDAGFKTDLLEKLRAIGSHRSTTARCTPGSAPPARQIEEHPEAIETDRIRACVVGSSTGGPPALEEIFSKIPARPRFPVIVAQHMPELFTRSLASRLNQHCPCPVSLATHGTVISEPGVYIAQGGSHIQPTRVAGGKIVTRLLESVPGAIYRPSVDLLFRTGAELFGNHLLAIQLTGMGADGVKGAQDIQDRGGQIVCQSGESCVVNGMPKAIVDAGLADCVLSPPTIRDLLARAQGDVSDGCKHPTSHFPAGYRRSA